MATLKSDYSKWRVVIYEDHVIIMRDHVIRAYSEFYECPFPPTILGLIQSAILIPPFVTGDLCKPNIMYLFAPEYPQKYAHQLSEELSKAGISVTNIEIFNSPVTSKAEGISPSCIADRYMKKECSFCFKPVEQAYWCKECDMVGYCNKECSNKDDIHTQMCKGIKEEYNKVSKLQDDYPFKSKATKKFFGDIEMFKKLVENNLHGELLFKNICQCYPALVPFELHSIIFTYICFRNREAHQGWIFPPLLSKNWDLNDLPYAGGNIAIDSWRKLYFTLRISENDPGFLIFYFPLTIWYIVSRVIIKQRSILSTSSGKKVLRMHVINSKREAENLLLLKIISLLLQDIHVIVTVFSDMRISDLSLPFSRVGTLSSGNVMFSVCPLKYTKKLYSESTDISAAGQNKSSKPDIVVSFPPDKGDVREQNEALEAALSDQKWVFFVDESFIGLEKTILDITKSDKNQYDVIRTHANPFRRPGAIRHPAHTKIPHWKCGYISGLRRKSS